MKFIILFLLLYSFVQAALAFRGGGGFRGGSISVGVGAGGMGPRGNVSVGVGVSGTRGTVSAHRSAAMSAHYHAYSPSYWGWYGYAPYHYYYPTTLSPAAEVPQTESDKVGTVVNEIPANCESKSINEIIYKHCGVKWYEPQFSGTEIEYEIVESPIKIN
jgi:hypothetical protein